MVLSAFHPAVARWFAHRLGEPTPPQVQGWPAIREGRHVLIAAPTGSGKTLAAFLWAIDRLLRQGEALGDETQVLYVSPLRALSNDVQKNLQGPLAEIRGDDPGLPDLRVLVRTGDTPAAERQSMTRRPPHILVTTPESLYLLLTSGGGRRILATVKTVIVDEIHALVRDKRGSHLGLSLERLEALSGPFQRIGLSATQKPLDEVGRFLAGAGRACTLVDAGSFREVDVAVEIPASPLETVCSHETWDEIYTRIADLIREHRTTLVFVNTRKLAERIGARLSEKLGADVVTTHHGSLARARRLDAEQRLKAGALKALVATASLELGIDVGDVDLAIQVGATRSIATFLQRVGRSGHALRRLPKGRIFPLTQDELVEAAALLGCVREGTLDRTPSAPRALDILAQQVVAACVSGPWQQDELLETLRRAWPYRDLTRDELDVVVSLHAQGRRALLHRDGVGGRLLATRRARLAALLSGGAIPDTADYQVRLEPDGMVVGTIHEDFAIESDVGDIFQLGNASWRILKVEPGVVRVADAKGLPPTLPFWLGEAPGRTRELSAESAALREACGPPGPEAVAALRGACGDGLPEGAALQIAEFVEAGRAVLGTVPTQRRVVLERFFDESGGMQLVLHAPFGQAINRAWGLALRKRFCVGFGFELQAAANEEAIVLSLGPQHSFELAEVFDYLHPATVRDVLVQAVLTSPLFTTRWRWNVQRSLLLERTRGGKKVPAYLQRMRADDLLVAAFPQVMACGETLPPGDIPVPMEHPIVRQTIEDCLHEAMDLDGLVEVLRGLRDGTIDRVAVDTAEPSAFARSVLAVRPYGFLDDAPLEERRTQAVAARRVLDARTADQLGALDPEAIARVREEAWPQPQDAEEVHEALLWMGYVTVEEARPWQAWIDALAAARRVVREGDRLFAAEAARDPKAVLRSRLEVLGPVFLAAGERGSSGDAATGGVAERWVIRDPGAEVHLRALEAEGAVLRARIEGREAWCHRRLLARIHRYTLERLRREIEPVAATDFLRFLACWQHADEAHRLEGPRGVAEVVRQLAGFEVAAAAWEGSVLPARVRGYRRDWLDQLTLSGEVAFARLWGSGSGALRTTPLCLVPREDLGAWLALSPPPDAPTGVAAQALGAFAARGALFAQEVARHAKLLPSHLELGLAELVTRGLATCDSFGGLRWLLVPPSRRRSPMPTTGRWSLLARETDAAASPEWIARQLLRRTGVVFRRTLERERLPVPWRDIARGCRDLEARGTIRGGRFVTGFAGEQYALPEAVELLRAVRRKGEVDRDAQALRRTATVSAADPLNFRGILTPDARVGVATRAVVAVG